MTEEKETRHLAYIDASLDPRVEASIREIAIIQSKITALEVINQDIKPELKELAKTKWGPATAWVVAFLAFMGFYAALERSMQFSDAKANAVGVEHNEKHVNDLEEKVRLLRQYVDEYKNMSKEDYYTKREHEIFDRERFAKLKDIEERLTWLEHTCTWKTAPTK